MNAHRHVLRRRAPIVLLIALIFAVTWIRSDRRPDAHLSFRLSGQSSTADTTNPSAPATAAATIVSGGIESMGGNGSAALVPGVSVRLILEVRNAKTTAVTVNDLAVAVGDASERCRADNLSVQQTSAPLLLPASATTKLGVIMQMVPTAPDACKNVTFPLSFSGTATGPDDAVIPAAEVLPPPATSPPAEGAVAAPPGNPQLQLDLGTGGLNKPVRPGAKVKLGGVAYPASCKTVYFFVDDIRIGSAHPDATGNVSKDGISIPGDTTTGTHHVRSSCSSTGHPSQASVAVAVVEPAFHLSGFVTSIPSPSQISFSPKDVSHTAGIMLLLIVVIAFSSELFNVVFETNYDQIRGWFRRGSADEDDDGGSSDGAAADADQADADQADDGQEIDGTSARARLGRVGRFTLFLLIGGVLFAIIDARFGFNWTSLALVAGMSMALLVLTIAWWLPYMIHMRRHHHEWGALDVVWGSLAVGGASVLLSRLLNFLPGFLFGVLAGLEFETELEDKIEGRMSALCSLSMTLTALGAWFLSVPVSAAASHGSPAVILVVLSSALVTIFMCGLESAVFALLPLKFMEGRYIVSWSKIAWVSIFGTGAFLFVHILLRPSTGYVSGGAPSMIDVLIAALSLMVISVSLWTYFHFFGSDDEGEGDPGEDGGNAVVERYASPELALRIN